jgi:hypothetical protein
VSTIKIGEAYISQNVQLRDESGRFLEAVDVGAERSVKELSDWVADNATSLAMQRLKKRTGRFLSQITSIRRGAKLSAVEIRAPYAEHLEEGTTPHNIPNSFGRGPEYGYGRHRSKPGKGYPNFFHPGNPPFRILADASKGAAAQGLAILRKNMPK